MNFSPKDYCRNLDCEINNLKKSFNLSKNKNLKKTLFIKKNLILYSKFV